MFNNPKLYAINEHDNNINEYKTKSEYVIDKFNSDNIYTIQKYDELIENILNL